MVQEELKKALEAHKHYLAQDCEGWENMRAELSCADLSDADLRSADLRNADLSCADLRSANLWSADLRNANLWSADLRNANLYDANLSEVDLSCANLSSANLSSADLRDADLYGADLRSANLSSADIRDADLRSADLRSANLSSANLMRANLSGADLRDAEYNERTAFFVLSCPEDGDFIAWKKVNNVIVKLKVPAEAKRSSATSRKCRCEYAEVLELQNLDGTPYNDDNVVNNNYVKTIYKVGEIARTDSWDADRWNECSHGIHFFITRDEAVRYHP